jgi:RNA polymerase sigma-70 factor (ECF subfamily)
MEEIQIIERVRAGHTEEFGRLVDRYSKMCYSIAYRVCQDADEAQDIAQDGLIAAFEHIGRFRLDSKFSTWLYRIVLNKALASKKKSNFFDEVENICVKEQDSEEEFHFQQALDIKKALTILNEKERIIIDLYYYQDQSIKEIAAICDISEVNVKVIMHRARKKMSETIISNSVNLST